MIFFFLAMTLMSCKISSVRGIPTKVRGSPTKFTNTAFLILALQKAFTTVFAGVAATLTSFKPLQFDGDGSHSDP